MRTKYSQRSEKIQHVKGMYWTVHHQRYFTTFGKIANSDNWKLLETKEMLPFIWKIRILSPTSARSVYPNFGPNPAGLTTPGCFRDHTTTLRRRGVGVYLRSWYSFKNSVIKVIQKKKTKHIKIFIRQTLFCEVKCRSASSHEEYYLSAVYGLQPYWSFSATHFSAAHFVCWLSV